MLSDGQISKNFVICWPIVTDLHMFLANCGGEDGCIRVEGGPVVNELET